MSVLVVTGTGTGVGKTITTAALASCAASTREYGRVAVVKPAQTGVAPDEPGDLAEVVRLSGVDRVYEFARYPDPLSPHHAAAVAGRPALDRGDVATKIAAVNGHADVVVVEGAGGLLVPFAADGWTLLDLAADLAAPVLVVVGAGLGTLNHTALTLRVLAAADVELAGVVIGSWPDEPGLAQRCNVPDLAAMAPHGRLDGVLPAGMATMRDFPERARAALSPQFGGTFDYPAFRAAVGA
jgi:dethiobiotin synthetase